jgi:hypothetical protein
MIKVKVGLKHEMIIDEEDIELFNSRSWKIVKADHKLVYAFSSKD